MDSELRSLMNVIQNFTAYPNTNTRMWQRTIQGILKEIAAGEKISGVKGISKLESKDLNKKGKTIFEIVNRNNTTSKVYKLMSIIRNLIPKFNGSETYEVMLHLARSIIKINKSSKIDVESTNDFLTTLFLYSDMYGTGMGKEFYNRFKTISWLTFQETGVWFDEWGRINRMPYYLGKGDENIEKQVRCAVATFKDNRDEIVNQLGRVRNLITSIKDLNEIKQEDVNDRYARGDISGKDMENLLIKVKKETLWFRERHLRMFLEEIGESKMSYDQTNKVMIVLDALYSVTLLDDRSSLIELARVSKTVLQQYSDMRYNVDRVLDSDQKRKSLVMSFKNKIEIAKSEVKNKNKNKNPEDDFFSL
jgi:hypothetical protein